MPAIVALVAGNVAVEERSRAYGLIAAATLALLAVLALVSLSFTGNIPTVQPGATVVE